ncbi:hypothetical protein [Acinetobacter baumannii]|uniref:hypothetical protein n=1 Tax=Acinetobacter baumannii TaxID=470 RepID=UPI00058071F5|nr:hypothetical protein [Acinetobacter baumannii]AJB67556.1 hypothetical protein RU84_11945 [Acinetobacter baumannii]EHU1392190.1 hypothetical protein [Acinetobacter baumannii]EHU2509984.1 hypothetical protein [Acinetobacter baumannii]EKU5045749.1 hypothetical protein [Acinetobacter baumannii]MCW1895722.1 hypothetical protein [Acinetobacter baumannii]
MFGNKLNNSFLTNTSKHHINFFSLARYFLATFLSGEAAAGGSAAITSEAAADYLRRDSNKD